MITIQQALNEKVSTFLEEEIVEIQIEEYTPTDIANFIHSLDAVTAKSIQKIIEEEFFERLSESFY